MGVATMRSLNGLGPQTQPKGWPTWWTIWVKKRPEPPPFEQNLLMLFVASKGLTF